MTEILRASGSAIEPLRPVSPHSTSKELCDREVII